MKKKNFLIIPIIPAILAGGIYACMNYQKYWKEPVPTAIDFSNLEKPKTSATQTSTEQTSQQPVEEPVNLPAELNLKMTFYAQAPFGNWDYPWQEACEEASVLLIANMYFDHQWTREEFNEEILKIVEWENNYFGDYKHTDVDETVVMLKKQLQLDSIVHENPTYQDFQEILGRGHFIVAPFAGKKLGNPFYKNGGPIYHMMVVKGYKDGGKIITADVGTRNGEDYVYSWDVIQSALHDFNEPIEQGAQRIIEVLPPSEQINSSDGF